MERKRWARLDNASNIFLAAMNTTDSKVFRLSAEMADRVDPAVLQAALDKTYQAYELYHSVLRRGFFWYYLEYSSIQPKVAEENLPPCTPLYHFDSKNLLFRVLYRQRRIHLEVFHALSDGTGAMWFFEDLLKNYVALKFPASIVSEIQKNHDSIKEQLEDGFRVHFRDSVNKTFRKATQSALQDVPQSSNAAFGSQQSVAAASSPAAGLPGRKDRAKKKTFRFKGTKTPDNRPHVVEMEMPVKAALALAKAGKVSLTVYMTAVFFLAVSRAGKMAPSQTISVSVPVNLRQFYPSNSARNFFSTVLLRYTFNGQDDSLETICRELDRQLKQELQPEKIGERVQQLIRFEYHPLLRLVLRPVKDGILKLANYLNNRNVTVAMSNLGKAGFPEAVSPHIERIYFYTVAVRPQFCMISYKDTLTLVFTSPYVERSVEKEFVRLLTGKGVPVTVSVNKVTPEELRGERS